MQVISQSVLERVHHGNDLPMTECYGNLYVTRGGKESSICDECTELVFPSYTLTSAKRLWQSSPEKWKWAYGQVEVEAQRNSTTESEIVEAYWKFTVLPFHSP